jgi:DNA polymerase/3'-5' exonuclease PolX
MELIKAKTIAQRYVDKLRPYCDKIMIAGSIRREKAWVKDIEIVCIPKRFCPESKNLFQEVIKEPERPLKEFCDIINSLEAVKGNPAGKYTQRILPEGIKLDLFMADKNNFGLIAMIRTGSADYSHDMMVIIDKKGFKSDGGQLINKDTGEIIPVPTEKDFYKITGIKFIKPKER